MTAHFAERLGQLDRLPRGDFAVDDDTYALIQRDLGEWRVQLLSHEHRRERLDRDLGHERESPGLEL